MSIRPPSDIVLDVARAVDPSQYAEASRRLSRGGSADAISFEAVLERAAGSRPRHLTDAGGILAERRTNASLFEGAAVGRPVDRGRDVYSGFEAMALTTFVETMLPAGGDSVFGGGTSGRIWKSLLAEKIAAEMAYAGGVGIADQLRSAAALRGTSESAAGMPSSTLGGGETLATGGALPSIGDDIAAAELS